jgi:hypothetical protein
MIPNCAARLITENPDFRAGLPRKPSTDRLTEGDMLFDPAKLPDQGWLTLFEATTYIAFGEALSQDDLRWYDYPSARTHYPRIRSVWERCRDEASVAHDGYPEFLKMIESFSREPFDPPPSAVLRRIARRPPSSQSLYKLLRRREQAQERDEQELAKAKLLILQALLSRDVVFTGVRDGTRENIRVSRCDGPPEIDVCRSAITGLYAGTVEAFSFKPTSSSDTIPMLFGKSIEWTDVHVRLAGLVAWRDGADNTAAKEAPPVREKKKRGPKPYYSEKAIVMIACHVAANPKVPGVTPATEKLIDETRKLHKKKWPKSRKPSRSTVQRALDKHGWP